MAEPLGPTSSDLADRFRLWIVVGGYVLGGWAAMQVAWGSIVFGELPFYHQFPFHIGVPMSIMQTASALYLVSPI